jgi:hypothetical protein
MNDTFLQSIIRNKKTCYFISPHFDDAIFSAGALMRYLSKYTKIVVINIFTKGGKKPYTLSATTYLKQCNYTDADKLFFDREKEDGIVLSSLTDKVINLGFVDALWRKKPEENIWTKLFSNIAELQMLYPTYRFHVTSGKVAKKDVETIVQIKKKLSDVVPSEQSVIFCPLGIGNHIDHVLARISCEKLFPEVIYWSDFPYNLNTAIDTSTLHSFQFTRDIQEKEKFIKGYVSQYHAMFKDGLDLKPEVFYFNSNTKI